MKIIKYNSSYLEELISFSKNVWPQKSEEYLRYRLLKFPETQKDAERNLLVLSDEGKIVGCNMVFTTRARICGEIEEISWSHDTYVDEKHRGDAGMMLMYEVAKSKNTFGFGLSEISIKIHRKLKASFIGKAYHYLIFNFWSFKLLFYKLKLLQPALPEKFSAPDQVVMGKYVFNREYNADNLEIPPEGFWSNEKVDIDFVRDRHFLNVRYFENFNQYYFYKLEGKFCYFVVRPVLEEGLPALSVVDFRYDFNCQAEYDLILKASSFIARKNRIPLVTLKTTLVFNRISLQPLIYRKNSLAVITSFRKLRNDLKVFVTKADSDMDFLIQ